MSTALRFTTASLIAVSIAFTYHASAFAAQGPGNDRPTFSIGAGSDRGSGSQEHDSVTPRFPGQGQSPSLTGTTSARFPDGFVRPEPQHASSSPFASDKARLQGKMPMRGLIGKIATIGSDSFTITAPANKEHATTTLTVQVSSATKFMQGSTTVAFSDISAGTDVMVIGKISTSTKSIAADRVMVGALSRPEPKKEGFFGKIKNFFTGSSDKTPAAVGAPSGTFTDALFQRLFGWI